MNSTIDSIDFITKHTFECTSLCRFSTDFDGKKWLYRLADIEYGELIPFSFDKAKPPFFDNRDRLFRNDGPSAEGAMGIWRWNASPRDTDVDRDYITSAYAEDLQPIEMVGLAGAKTLEELTKALTAGVEAMPTCTRVFFCSKEQLLGNTRQIDCIYCTIDEISFANRRAALKSGIARISTATIARENIINTQGNYFYRYITVREPLHSIPVLNPDKVVRQAIMERFTWPVAKGYGITKSEWKLVKDFITEVPADEIWKQVAVACQCSESEAKQYFERFIERAEANINREDFDDRVLLDLISNHQGLQERCTLLVEQTWRETHKQEIDAATEELGNLQNAAKDERDSVESKKKERELLEEELLKLNQQIEKKKKIAEEISQRVNERIESARGDSSAFLAELITLNPSTGVGVAPVAQRVDESTCFESGIELDSKELEVHKDDTGVVETLRFELLEAGIAEKYSFELAAFLYAAFSCHLPILLAGPNGDSIADALSASIYGRTADKMNCWSSCNQMILEQIGHQENRILTIKNAFQGDWIMHLPDMLDSRTYCVVVHPFAEDLAVEPRDVYNYLLPVLTGSFVDSTPARNYVGGRMDDGFKPLALPSVKSVHEKLFRQLRMPRLFRKNLQKVLAYYHLLINRDEGDLETLLSAVPYAYLTNHVNQSVFDDICDEMNIGSEIKEEISLLLGESDE